jgi:hypothetical protein
VIVNLPGTPHWLSDIPDAIEYFEIQIPNMDPAPGIERAEVLPRRNETEDAVNGVPPNTASQPETSAAV